MPMPGGATAAFAERQLNRTQPISTLSVIEDSSPVKMKISPGLLHQSLLDQVPEHELMEDVSFEMDGGKSLMDSPLKDVFMSDKENVPV
jgi:centromeric protein E